MEWGASCGVANYDSTGELLTITLCSTEARMFAEADRLRAAFPDHRIELAPSKLRVGNGAVAESVGG